MKRSSKSVRSLKSLLRGLGDDGVLEPGQKEAAEKHLRELERAVNAGDLSRSKAALNKFAKEFVRLFSGS